MRHPHATATDALIDFSQLVTGLQDRLPLAPSRNNPYRFFMANGSSVSLEVGGFADFRTALFEIATPECTSPRDVVLYQLANEQLMEDAFADDHSREAWALIKSNTDAQGHTLGQHESYDMQIARGKWLLLWWLGLTLILPALLLYRTLASIWMLLIYTLCALSQGLRQISVGFWNRITTRLRSTPPAGASKPWKRSRTGGFLHALQGLFREPSLSAFWMHIAATGLRWLHRPIAIAFEGLIFCVVLRPHRRRMSAFLASRCILDGAGYVDEGSRFWVSQRAAMVNRMIGFGSYGRSRPMFRCDPMLRDLLSGPFWSLSRFRRLYRPMQRIELAIGDSGMCQHSQYLRFGTTSLVLDMVEFSALKDPPRLRNAVDAIGQFARDWFLVRTLLDSRRREQSALDLQRWYAKQLKLWLEKRADVPPEAWRILDVWQTTLNQLVMKRSGKTEVPRMLVGRIDWLSKLWLVQQMDPDTAWQVRKKIDIRYHELSDSGYHRKLTELVQIAPLVRDEEIARARRSPPKDSPARRRGNLIREFAGSSSDLRVDWRSASYDLEGTRYRIDF